MKSTGVVACAVILTASCSMGPIYVEEDFGRSVRQMIEGQISDPEAATDPSSSPSDLLDGVSAEESLTGYRKGAKREDGTQRDIQLSVD